MTQDLLYEQKDRVVTLTINREAKRNAISQEMIQAFHEYLDRADGDDSVRAVCVTGVGEKAFCSGADLGATFSGQQNDKTGGPRHYAGLMKRMARFGKPLVARVNGPCLAGGIGFMLSCDIVIARNDTFFSTPEVNVGIWPMMIGALIYRNVSRKKATEMVLTGRRIPAPEAEAMGLITKAVDPADLDRVVAETLDNLASKSPIGMRIGKESFRVMSDMPFDEALDYLCDALLRVAATEDAREGMTAFLEKRKPEFKGR
ncbi:MAG: enoyl-CoA hydratase/isomerase family protein [Deltaproteobacteria bacterium]|nr:enoyl-CoA hydratase/isomerase family protein [Deltaproteobacteria bacterium]MBW1924814.1 enoyl-CoA hydratase/isomerase family protein [Deltaproteobacteria bacterium]MBW1950779.1 enoyl-CoA hydratase/isomerase family protein [Deltaproteobacteria bacterium]MBW2009087.1 enoyl-CoA hydratase/isomerase family protein [Deltaproteobacteria bacterium]MBW2103548.1 enoyl-CoA hydratase/isomerase family protein [Deltaproteobacteria bacterium]